MKEYIENENDAILRYPLNFAGGYSFVNPGIINAWGYPRGYLIHPGNSPIFKVRLLVHFGYFSTHPSASTFCLPFVFFQTVIGSKRVLKNANWARYNLAVSLHRRSLHLV